MGMDPNGILAYGYDLGGPEHWRLNKPEAGLGIQIVDYGSDGYRGYILCTTSFSSPDYDAMIVEPNLIDHSAADRLYRALEVLEIEPTQAEPRWILASYYG